MVFVWIFPCQALIKHMEEDINTMEELHHQLYLGTTKLRHLGEAYRWAVMLAPTMSTVD